MDIPNFGADGPGVHVGGGEGRHESCRGPSFRWDGGGVGGSALVILEAGRQARGPSGGWDPGSGKCAP